MTDYPERDFFFGILATLRKDYLVSIIKDAHAVRINEGKNDQEKNFIMASDSWIKDLTKHPFISSKIKILIFIEKPGKAIYLMKQRSKLVRSKKSSKKHPLQKRLSDGL